MHEEWFPLVDEEGRVVGRALRSQCHGDPSLIHPVVHLLVFDGTGGLLLQLRSRDKDVQPGKWDTSVGGHVGIDEAMEAAVKRETKEELGIDTDRLDLRFLHRYLNRSSIETELVHTFACICSGPFQPDPGEIDEVRFWTREEIERSLGSGLFTPNFEDEFARSREEDALWGRGPAES